MPASDWIFMVAIAAPVDAFAVARARPGGRAAAVAAPETGGTSR